MLSWPALSVERLSVCRFLEQARALAVLVLGYLPAGVALVEDLASPTLPVRALGRARG